MSSISEWAAVLAEAAAPGEAATAALVAEAYARGGRHRRQLMEESGALTGGFGSGDLEVLFPSVLAALHAAAPLLLTVLASRRAGELLQTVHAALTNAAAPPRESGASITVSGLNRATDLVEKSLGDAGVGRAEAPLMALHVVHALLRDAESGRRFIQFIAEKP